MIANDSTDPCNGANYPPAVLAVLDGVPMTGWQLSGHISRDRSECVNVIGVISQPSAMNGGRQRIAIVRVISIFA